RTSCRAFLASSMNSLELFFTRLLPDSERKIRPQPLEMLAGPNARCNVQKKFHIEILMDFHHGVSSPAWGQSATVVVEHQTGISVRERIMRKALIAGVLTGMCGLAMGQP